MAGLVYDTPYGRGRLTTTPIVPTVAFAGAASRIAAGNGSRVALHFAGFGAAAISAAQCGYFLLGGFTSPRVIIAVSGARPSITVTREEIGDAITEDVWQLGVGTTIGAFVSQTVFEPEGSY